MCNVITCGEIAEALREQINTREIDGRGLHGRRSAWDRGLIKYAGLILSNALEWRERVTAPAPDHITREIAAWLMDGAKSWSEYSYGGCALIYNEDIARTLCAQWELRRTRYGARRPNSRETWPDVQTRALMQAAAWIGHNWRAAYNVLSGGEGNA